MKTGIVNINMTVIMVEDPKVGGFTAFFKQLPNIVAEGENSDEALNNLLNAVNDVFSYKASTYKNELGNDFNFIEKPVELTLNV